MICCGTHIMEKYERPALCRLCKFPVTTNSVPLSDVDIVKLSRWWRKALQTEYEVETLEGKFVCHFCICDAKYLGEREESDGCDWWDDLRINKIYQQFCFDEEVIHRCQVEISLLKLPVVETSNVKAPIGVRLETVCIFCSEVFESRRAAFQHVAKAHMGVKAFPCKRCFLTFKSSREKVAHCREVHVRHSEIRCHLCLKNVDASLLVHHITENHSELSDDHFECCKSKFLDVKQLLVHMKSNLVHKLVKCVYCKKSSTINCLSNHMARHHDLETIKCQYKSCGKYFLNENARKQHVVQVHDARNDLVECIYCRCKFTLANLPKHVVQSHNSQSIKCNYHKHCRVYFHTEDEKRQHVMDVHMSTGSALQSFRCEQCDKTFCSKGNLQRHVTKVHKLKVRFCMHRGCCDYFLTQTELERHSHETHSAAEEKKFPCAQCSFRTHTANLLKRHVAGIHNTKELRCHLCDKVYTNKFAFQHHNVYTHGEKKVCPHCNLHVQFLSEHLRVAPCSNCKLVVACRGLKKRHWEELHRKMKN